jgi:DNA polymerase I
VSSGIVLIIDLSNHVYADWHATGARAAEVFRRRADAVAESIGPVSVAVACDSENSFRRDIFPTYKAGRKPPESELLTAMQACKDACADNGWSLLRSDGFEADDIIATCAKRAVDMGFKAVMFSGDKDCRQLLRDGQASILRKASFTSGQLSLEWLTARLLLSDFGFTPEQFLDYQTLVGDSTDKIPGIKGFGQKIATALLTSSGSISEAVRNPWTIPGLSTKQRDTLLAAAKPGGELERQRRLVKLRDDVPLDWVP